MELMPLVVAAAIAALGACSSTTPEPPQARPGSDRDEHGCIPSAGYTWCARTNRCERPWELAKERGFENTAEAFAGFCQGPADVP